MKNLTFLIKPASSLCDMACRYCFYDDVSDSRQCKSMGLMTRDTARRLVQAGFQDLEEGGRVQFFFQGGEPTLAGLEFFRHFLDLERELCPPGVTAENAIQTNGMTLDREWAAFLAQNGFLVGLSLDGTRELHDRYRLDPRGRGSWDRAAAALKLLEEAGAETNLLCVVTGPMARRAQRVYRSLKGLGSHPLQFIPCLDPLEGERGRMDYSLTPQAYGQFLCGLFDCWYQDWQRGQYVSIRTFDDYIRLLLGMAPGSCAAAGICGSYLVVEGDGSLYPCDFYVLDQWRLGNIREMSPAQALSSPLSREFLAQGARRPAECGACPYLAVCRGGCRRDWVQRGPEWGNYYCQAFQTFFAYALPRLRQAAGQVRAGT